MGANQQYTRIDTLELKALLHQKIGQQRSEKYFNLLNKLFSLQLSKSDFDKFCIRTIGRENLPLHNRLISSIVRNAALAKVPPPTVKKLANSLNVKVSRAPQRNSLQTLYGDAFPLSPRKSRSPRSPRDRKFKDRFSPLGPNGSKVHQEAHQSPTELHSLGSRPPVEVLSVEDGEEVVSGSPGIQSRSPVTAPLGITLKLGPARKTIHHSTGSRPRSHTCENSYELPDSRSLRGRLKEKLDPEGLSISDDCVNLLNVGLDAYLKRLMEPCIGLLARSKIGRAAPGSYRQRLRTPAVSVLDFNVAMECDPSKLGTDWATRYERLCFSAFK
ncbi:putative transcriptional coactivator Hfi1/Transcriptional adapter 1 [Helianthus annuus]|nr:putative transcriptional coactivator Hfi1/Transcriptional adapter 1 [Helianthus annuus]